jgi:ribosomal subunit interface protein
MSRTPAQIVLRDVEHSPALDEHIQARIAELDEFYDHILTCRVVVSSPHHHRHSGRIWHVLIDLGVPGREIVVNQHSERDSAHADVYVTLRDAFTAAQRQLQDHAKRRSEVRL